MKCSHRGGDFNSPFLPLTKTMLSFGGFWWRAMAHGWFIAFSRYHFHLQRFVKAFYLWLAESDTGGLNGFWKREGHYHHYYTGQHVIKKNSPSFHINFATASQLSYLVIAGGKRRGKCLFQNEASRFFLLYDWDGDDKVKNQTVKLDCKRLCASASLSFVVTERDV